MEEIWKDIPNYEGFYQISNLGRVKRLETKVISYSKNQTTFFKCVRNFKEKELKPINVRGYLHICLSKNNTKKIKQIHRLVAQAFIPNPDNLPQINHKDENPQNNCVDNLEWCTAKYNCNYGNRNKKITGRPKKEEVV